MTKEIWTIGRILKWTEQYFREKGVETPRLDGEVLLSHILKKDRIYCYAHYDQPLNKDELAKYKKYILERVSGKSVATIIGKKEFMGLSFKVNKDVLIPRPDTETLVEGLLTFTDRQGKYRILDICSGPGTILLSLLHYLPNASGIGLELSTKAIAVAEENLEHLGCKDRAIFIKSNLLSSLSGDSYEESFDFIVSNPPYIKKAELANLPLEVKHEPLMALDGGAEGLDFYEPIMMESFSFLKKGGYLIFEFGQGQEIAIENIAKRLGIYKIHETWKDLNGITRNIVLQKEG